MSLITKNEPYETGGKYPTAPAINTQHAEPGDICDYITEYRLVIYRNRIAQAIHFSPGAHFTSLA